MQKITFSMTINADKEKVWEVLWNDSSYKQWTSVFSEGSYAVTDWNEGSKVLFLGANDEGMVSKIERKRPNEFMSFRHLGVVKNGVEDVDSEETKKWSGALENYTLTETRGVTMLTVEMDITEDHKAYFMEKFPKALEQVKALSEN